MRKHLIVRAALLWILSFVLSSCSYDGSISGRSDLTSPSIIPNLTSPILRFKQNHISLTEGQDSLAEIELTEAQATDVIVYLTLSSTDGLNRLSPLPSFVTIPAGQTSVTLPLNTIDDAIVHASQTWVVTLTYLGVGLTLPNRELIITLYDNDGGTTAGAGTSAVGPILLKSFNNTPVAISKIAMNNGKVIYLGTDASHGTEVWVSDGTGVGTFMLKDIYPGTKSSDASQFYLNTTQNVVYFRASTPNEGQELWRTDGTIAGTYLVKDIVSGTSSPALVFVSQIGNYTLFKASTAASGAEVWTTDGTEAGTQLLVEASPGVTGGTYSNFILFNGFLYFATGREGFYLRKTDGTPAGTSIVHTATALANTVVPNCLLEFNSKIYFLGYEAANQGELWSSDGTSAGTAMVKNIHTGSGSDACPLAALSSKLILRAVDATWSTKIWASDGTSAGTIALGGTSPSYFGKVGDKVIFSSNGEPWITDGTIGGTVILKDIHPSTGSSPEYVANLGSKMIFKADNGTAGTELWVTDGTTAGTQILKDILPGILSSKPTDFQVVGARLFFTAITSTGGRELWVTDGTTAGTVEFMDLYPGPSSSSPKNLLALDSNRFFFTAYNSAVQAATVYFSDSTLLGTGPVANSLIQTEDVPYATSPQEFGGSLYLATSENGFGHQLWKTSGTEASTTKIIDLNPISEDFLMQLLPSASSLLIHTTTVDEGTELWQSDGSAVGTQVLQEAEAGPSNVLTSWLTNYISVGSKYVYKQDTAATGDEYWVTDGTVGGTFLLKDMQSGPGGFYETSAVLNSAQSKMFFNADGMQEIWASDLTTAGTIQLSPAFSAVNYHFSYLVPGDSAKTYIILNDAFTDFGNGGTAELWKSDGTLAGTTKISPSAGFRVKQYLYARSLPNGKLVFWGTEGTSGIEPWVSDGTAGGTIRLVDANAGAGSSTTSGSGFAKIGNKFLFRTTTPAATWITDGTPAGTSQLFSGTVNFDPIELGGIYYMNVTTAGEGIELWKTDGTPAGTSLVKDINPGTSSSNPNNFIVFNGKLYFAAADSVAGRELWVTDGTTAGTQMVADINPGLADSSPQQFSIVGGKLYMQATKVLLGQELWVMAP